MRYKKWRYIFNEYFTFTRRERNGVYVLLFILTSLQVSIFILHFLPDPQPLILDAATKYKLETFEQSIRKKIPDKKYKNVNYKKEETTFQEPELFYFNPNALSTAEWIRLGFSEKQSETIIRWRERIGKFKSKEDLAKIFVISEEKYKKLEPFIQIPDSDKKEIKIFAKTDFTKKKIEYPLIEINAAPESTLMHLPLIGEGRAHSIAKYREFLGGFINTNQLKEVYGLPDSVLEKLIPRVSIDTTKRKFININSADIMSFKHPYISRSLAKIIMGYHAEHGNFKTVESLKQIPMIDEELYRKIAPYLSVENK